MKNARNVIIVCILTIITVLAIIIVGPVDFFSHGYYCDELNYDIVKEDIIDTYDLKEGVFEMSFSPKNHHFVGFEINIANQPDNNVGILKMEIQSERGKLLDTIYVDLSKVEERQWYKTYTEANLKKGKIYKLLISAVNCDTYPHLQIIDPDYLSENIEGDLYIGYAYAKSTFSSQQKVLFFMFIVAVLVFLISKLLGIERVRFYGQYFSLIVFLTTILAWNYMYNSMDVKNVLFEDFQADSEYLVKSIIEAEENGTWFEEKAYNDFVEKDIYYGLGGYSSCMTPLNDDYWLEGYCRERASVVVGSSEYAKEYAKIGNYIKFANGECLRIWSIYDDDVFIIIYLEPERILNPYKYGDLKDAYYCNQNQETIAPLNNGVAEPYRSQYGLQGHVFRNLSKFMNNEEVIPNLYLLCSIATGIVFSSIVILIYKKYNMIFAGTFFVTFWLSPWVVSFARTLYWVECTWFLPMAIGLFCAWKIESRLCRVLSYLAAFVAILVKCLCGYEFISVVMMGLISFLLVDFVLSLKNRDRESALRLGKCIVIIGVLALLGFFVAISMHGYLRGNGNIFEGIKIIFEQDVLRRTQGADLNEFAQVYWPSFNASVWETVSQYFRFNTEVITGIPGNLFPVICIAPLVIFAYEVKNKKVNYELIIMYVIFFATSISWFCLAKGHSYIHLHVNFVLWYFGYIQVCLYIIVKKIADGFRIKSINASK